MKSFEQALVLITFTWMCFTAGCDDNSSPTQMQGPVGIVDTNPTGPGQLGVMLSSKSAFTLAIVEVMAEGPADLAGILPGDLIASIGGVAVTTYDEWLAQTKLTKPHQVVEIEFVRDGQTMSVNVRLCSHLELMLLPDAGDYFPMLR